MNYIKSEEETSKVLSIFCKMRKEVSSCLSISSGREMSLEETEGRYPKEERRE